MSILGGLMSEKSAKQAELYEKLLKETEVALSRTYPTTTGIYTPSPTSGAGSWPRPVRGISSLPSGSAVFEDISSYHLLVDFCMRNDIWLRRTGSQLVEGIEPNDLDYVADDPNGILEEWLNITGWVRGGSEREEEEFSSYKQGKYNVIICHTREYFTKYLMATELLVKLQPKTKQERIDIFDTVIGTKNNPETMVPF